MITFSNKDVKKILDKIYINFCEKVSDIYLYAPTEYDEDIHIPTEFFDEVFKKHKINLRELDMEEEEFIEDYYIGIRDFLEGVLDTVINDFIKGYKGED